MPVILRRNAARFAGKVAFSDGRRAVTYDQLEERTRRLAGHLSGLGVRRGDRVMICLRNCVSMVESYLAVVRAGGVGVPVNPASTAAETDWLLADSGAVVVVTDAVRAPEFLRRPAPAPGVTVLVTGTDPAPEGTRSFDELAVTEPATPAPDDLGLDQPAWMFYTSGTTGQPKGVLSTQRNCLWSVASSYVPIPGLSPEDRVLWPLPLFHSLSHIACVLSVTVVGASAHLMDGASAEDVLTALRARRSTFLAGVPTTYHYLVEAIRRQPFSLPDLRIGLVGGAVADPGLCRAFRESFGTPLVDAYGSTETCGAITMNPPDGMRVDGSCGLPVPGVEVRLVDPDTGTDVPTGCEGEVWVSGPNVMLGYHGRPEETAAATRDGWYRTGDLARRDEHGYFTVCGRLSDLVIRGGENLHPEEVETVLRAAPGVADAGVSGRPHDTLGEVPVAHVVPASGELDVPAVVEFCRARLAAFKVPEEIHEVAEIPRTASGKITRRVLAEQPAVLRYAASGHHDDLFEVDWVRASAPVSGAGPASWAMVGPGAAAPAAAWPGGAAHHADLADADGTAEVTVVLQAEDTGRGSVAAARTAARRFAERLADWLARTEDGRGRLLVLTRGAVPALPGDGAPDPAQAALRAAARALQTRYPDRLVVADLDADGEPAPAALTSALAADEPWPALRSGVPYVPRLVRVPVDDRPRRPWPGAKGTVVVTGAATARGAAVVRHLVSVHRVQHLLLVGEEAAPGPDVTGADVRWSSGRKRSLRAAIAGVAAPVTAVIHADGDLAPAAIAAAATAGQPHGRTFLVIADLAVPAVAPDGGGASEGTGGTDGTGASDGIGGTDDPDALVAAVLAEAVARRHDGSFLSWPQDGALDPRRVRAGLSAMDTLLTGDRSSLLCLRVRRPAAGAAVPPLLRALFPDAGARSRPDDAVTAALREELARLDEPARRSWWERLVGEQTASVLPGSAPHVPLPDRAFRDLGLTSVAVVELRDRLTERTGLRLPTTITFDHPTPRALAEHLHAEVSGGPGPAAKDARAAEDAPAAGADDPVVIVGMACRLPGGVGSPDELWRLVCEGRDTLSPFPTDRGWNTEDLFDTDPNRFGTSYVDRGGFLPDAGEFDAGFFGISPREALAMDPQQRLLLETSWEALEHSGIDASTLRGTDVGVFSGVMEQGYAASGAVPQEAEAFAAAGRAASVASGRVSYVLGFTGPAVTVDTACSSSLVALHLAAQALRAGECSMALAGGATVMATPRTFVEFSRQRALAGDGRCKSFASAADGTGWAEGAGVLVLERLSDARRRGHRVLAVVRGSAVNQDGASNGLTAPNGLAQQRVIGRALAAAGLSAADVDAIEAHGTGTVLGDPIEAGALLAAYGRGRDPERPLWLASLKSNIGHTQAAAGVAGVIKIVQALRHAVLPATRHVDEPTTKVDWSAGAVSLLTENRPWPDTGRPRRAGVSSFGLSGTNAHVILEQAPAARDETPVTDEGTPTRGEEGPEAAEATPAAPAVVPLVLSARSEGALRGQARRLASLLEDSGESWTDVATALVSRRTLLEERAVVLAGSRAQALAALAALAAGESSPAVVRGTAAASDAHRRVVMVFPGQGSQWTGMGRELLAHSPVFAERVGACARLLARWTDWSLLDVLRGDADPELLQRVDVVQPASFAVMVGLAAVWESVGVRPDVVVGHSQGEIAAACVAGALSLEDALRVVALRSRAIAARLSGRGGMAWVALGEEAAAERVRPWGGRLAVAAVNGTASVVVSGAADALDEVLAELADDGVRVRRVAVDYASHSEQVEDIREALEEALGGLDAKAPTVPFHSTVTGGPVVDAGVLDGEYWWRNLRRQVRFGPVVGRLLDQGHSVFLEVSAHPVLVQAVTEILDEAAVPAVVTGTLRRDDGGPPRLAASMAELFVRGVAVDWTPLLPAPAADWVELPTYAFDRRHYWLRTAPAGDPAALGLTDAGHPLLGAVVRTPHPDGAVATARWSTAPHPWLSAAGDPVVVPDAALVELVVRLGDETGTPVADELTVDRPVTLPRHGGRVVQVVVGEADDDGRRPVEVHSRDGAAAPDGPWTRHAHGVLAPDSEAADLPGLGDPAEAVLPESALGDVPRYGIHPALLDAAVRTALPGNTRVTRWSGVRLLASGASALRVRSGATTPAGDGHRVAGLELVTTTGRPVMTVDALEAEPVTEDHGGPADHLLALEWRPWSPDGTTAAADVRHVTTAADVTAATGADLLVYEARPAEPRTAVASALAVLQAFVAAPGTATTRCAVVVPDGTDPGTAAVGGLVRSAQSEHPGRIVLVEADEAGRARVPAAATGGEPWLRITDGRTEVPRLARPALTGAARPLDPAGTVLITGGTGTLGALTARHLVTRHGVRHLVLAGRQGPAARGARELAAELTALGADVTLAPVDVADRARLAALIDAVPAEHPLTAVVHSAGVLDDGVLTALTPSRLDAVFGPKLDAALHLDELTRDLDLAAFVLFSSAAGVLGNPGQGNYAAANAALDALAARRHALGLPAVSIAWGYWSRSSGLTRHLGDTDLRRNESIGMTGLSDAEGMAQFDAALRAGPRCVAAKLDPAALAAADAPVPAPLRGLVPRRRPVVRAAVADAGPTAAERLTGLPPAEQSAALLAAVRRHAAAVLGHAGPGSVGADRTFKDAGFDSLTALELRNRLAAETGLTLSPAVIFDYPRPVALAEHLRARLLGGPASPAAPARREAPAEEDPIAVVSMACRFPAGVRGPEDLWRVVSEGIDAVGAFPEDRGWDTDALFHPDPDHPGTTYVRHGAFLDDAAGFDAAFFGISPNEALAMDPQQRLLLETAWETFERAGIDPTALAGQDVGVFAGINSHDWSVRLHRAAEVEGFRLTGSSGGVLSGRIAYHLGLVGPALTVDTACSSSLVALHLATQAMRLGECSMALVGGVMVMGDAETFVEFSRQRGLAPDGRCKAFADAADGTGWSEGAGLLLLEPLSRARRHGHPVLAVVRGSAVNSDGASNGLTAPNGPSQQRVIRQALAVSGLGPADVDAVEAHGTGTVLGDPIEAQALLATYGQGRPAERPLWLGSVKSNIGHTQAAAGVAGVIKMVQALRHGVLPPTLHVDRPSTHVDWTAGDVRLLTEARDWPETGRPRRAGVSSFGIGGTNAHVILEQAPDPEEPASGPVTGAAGSGAEPARASGRPLPGAAHRPAGSAPEAAGPARVPVPVPVSARTPAALRAQAALLADFLAGRPEVSLTDTALALATGRAHLDRRAVLLADDRDRLLDGLRALADGAAADVTGSPADGRLAFLFTGQGSQWAGMGRALAEAFPVFAEAFADACAAVERHLGDHDVRPLAEVAFAEPGSAEGELLDRTLYTQTCVFALETALFRLLASWGVHPDIVAGHSVGEITAAHVSGVLGLAEAGEMVAARGRLMQGLPPGGAMAAVQATEAETAPLLARAPGAVAVAAVNSPGSLVLSGEEDAVLAVVRELAARGRRTRRLPVSHAFHSPLMAPMREEFRAVAERLTYRPGELPVVSTVTGALVTDGRLAGPDHWVDQVEAPVRFGDAVTALCAQGAVTFTEVGPGGALVAMALESPDVPAEGCFPTLRENGAAADVLAALAALHTRGVPVDWPAVLGGPPAGPLAAELPTYAFQHRRYWLDEPAPGGSAPVRALPETGPADDAVPAADAVPAGGAVPAADRSGADRRDTFLELIRESTTVVLGHHGDEVFDEDQPFKSLGFDSLTGVRLSRRLQDLTGVPVPATAVFDHPTPAALAAYLLGEDRSSDVAVAVPSYAGEPIAIVGMSTRLPGDVNSPEELWRLVAEGRDAVSGFPIDRDWDLEALYHPDPAHPGTSYTRAGGFLHDAAQFDAALFGISPREALAMDPQQRLLLETSWEALEHAGIDPLSARGRDVGVFTGIVHHDYVTRLRSVPEEAQGYVMTGTSSSVASGRVSYVFGFEGPAVTVDTACSSSLVAIHLAAQALRQGECSLALAGGATVMASPDAFVEFSRQRGLSADGRCKAFSSTADGTGWSEGVGVVVLERLSVAREKGHRVLAVVRGSAVNSDGASNGLTAPNGPSQQRVIRQALAVSGLGPADVDAVEAHGTGTVLGDPIEAQALLATYGQGRPAERPLWLGSVKSNIGHTQAAAGVAGVIKMVQALRHGVLPPTLHVEEPTRQVDWSSGAVRLLTEAREWPRGDRPRRAAVSAFGASGTNAHLVIEEAGPVPEESRPAVPVPPADAETPLVLPDGADAPPPVLPLVLSARTPGSLAAQAGRTAAFLGRPDAPSLPAVASTLVTARATLTERAVVVAGTRTEALAGLEALARGESAPHVVTGSAAPAPGKVVLVFPGQGAQWAGMGRELLDASPVFAQRIAECARALEPWIDWSLTDVLRGDVDAGTLERVDVVQPASFAMMIGLAAVWAAAGVLPDAVVGHSQGEIAAACVAGALSLETAARIVAVRSRAIAATLSGRGGMASVALDAEEARRRLLPWDGRVEVAAVNGPASAVVAGDTEALDEALDALAAQGVRVRRVPVDYASHTRHVEELEEVLAQALAGVEASAPRVPFHSTVTGERVTDDSVLDAAYWYRNLRRPVGFGPAVEELLRLRYGVFVEVSAHPVLIQPVTDLADGSAAGPSRTVVCGTLRRGDGGLGRLLASAAQLFTGGVAVDWSALLPAGVTPAPDLPTYAFERRHYWLGEDPAPDRGAGAAEGADDDFWTAVEHRDVGSLGELLALSGDQRAALGSLVPALTDWRRGRRERGAVEKLRYTVTWKPLERDSVGVPGGRWLVVLPDGARPDDLLEELTGLGFDPLPLTAGETDRAALAERLTDALAACEVSGVLSLLALGEHPGTGPQDPTALTASTLALVQALGDAGVTAPLWCVTRGAVDIGIRDTLEAPAQAALWGLGRVVALERPDRWGGLIDLPADPGPRTAQRLLGVLGAASGEDQLAIRRSGVYVRRLVRKPVPRSADAGWRPRGTVLVTGGAEGLGRHTSLWLARNGAARLVVTTTSGAPEDCVDRLRAELGGSGTELESCAQRDTGRLAELLSADPRRPLTAVVHAADVTQAGPLDDTAAADLAAVFGTKVEPALWLAERFAGTPLDAFVVFSSIAGVWGGGGQGPSGAANAVLDALVEWRRGRGLAATAVAWGALDEIGVGMDEAALAQLRRRGVLPIAPELAVTALAQVAETGEKTVTVADMDWAAFVPAFTSVRPGPLFAELPEAADVLRAAAADDGGETTSSLVDSLRAVAEAEQERMLLRLVRGQAAAVLGHSGADAIGPAQAFQEAGFDSLAAVNFRNGLHTATGLTLPSTLVFDYPTPEALVGHLREELLRDPGDDPEAREEDLRRVLATVALERFREAGVLETLLALADDGGTAGEEAGAVAAVRDDDGEDEEDAIDAMDVDSLVQRVLGASG
ncbi:type I polyketide synthase [Streptomyces sp. NPDC003401]